MNNNDEAYQKKMDAVWEKFLVSLAIEKMRKLEKLERNGAAGAAKKGA